LSAKARELAEIAKSDLVRACGYISIKRDGNERINFRGRSIKRCSAPKASTSSWAAARSGWFLSAAPMKRIEPRGRQRALASGWPVPALRD